MLKYYIINVYKLTGERRQREFLAPLSLKLKENKYNFHTIQTPCINPYLPVGRVYSFLKYKFIQVISDSCGDI